MTQLRSIRSNRRRFAAIITTGAMAVSGVLFSATVAGCGETHSVDNNSVARKVSLVSVPPPKVTGHNVLLELAGTLVKLKPARKLTQYGCDGVPTVDGTLLSRAHDRGYLRFGKRPISVAAATILRPGVSDQVFLKRVGSRYPIQLERHALVALSVPYIVHSGAITARYFLCTT